MKEHKSESKLEAISLYKSGYNKSAISRKLDIPRSTVRGWLSDIEIEEEKEDDASLVARKCVITSFLVGSSLCKATIKYLENYVKQGYPVYVFPVNGAVGYFKSVNLDTLPELPAGFEYIFSKDIEVANLKICNLTGHRMTLSHFKTVSKHVVVPHNTFDILSTPNVFSKEVKYVVGTGTVSDLNKIERSSHAKLSKFRNSKNGGLLIHGDSLTHLDAQEASVPSFADAIVLGDVHLPQSKNDFASFIEKLKNYIQTYKPKSIFLHDYIDGGMFSHHLYNTSPFDTLVRSEGAISDYIVQTKNQHNMIVSLLKEHNIAINIVKSNHDSHVVKGLVTQVPKNLKNKLELSLYFKLGAEIISNKNLVDAYLKTIGCEVEGIQYTDVNEPKEVGGYSLSLHGDKGINGSRFDSRQVSLLGVKAIVGHAHSASRSGDVLTVGTNSGINLGYNQNGLSSWSNVDVIVYSNSATHLLKI